MEKEFESIPDAIRICKSNLKEDIRTIKVYTDVFLNSTLNNPQKVLDVIFSLAARPAKIAKIIKDLEEYWEMCGPSEDDKKPQSGHN